MIALSPQAIDPERLIDADEDLMLSVRDGNIGAFEELTLRYRVRVMQLITRLMGHASHSEDLVQEVFLRVFRARHNYIVSAKFTTWLYTIVNNVVSNARRNLAMRRETRLGDHELSHVGLNYFGAGTPAEEPAKIALREESRWIVNRAVRQLSNRQQTVVSLYYYERMNYAAIAQAMDTTQEAIKSLLARARTNLRLSLTPYAERGLATG